MRNHQRIRRRFIARRLEIVRAAGRLFRVRGLAQTGMREIAEAADLSPANLYNYFKGKGELLFFCQDNSLDRMLGSVEAARTLKASAGEKLLLVIASHVKCVLDEVEGTAAHLLTSPLPAAFNRRLIAKRDRYEKAVTQLIHAGIESGEFISADPTLVTRAILGALNWSVRWFNPAGELTPVQVGDQFARYLVRGLLAKPNSGSRERHQRKNLKRRATRQKLPVRRKKKTGAFDGE